MDSIITGSLIGAGSTLTTTGVAMLISRVRKNTRHEDRLASHEDRIGKLENATSTLSDKIDNRFDRIDNKIDNLVGKLIEHIEHGSK
jgi:hypothetical protein